jgi:hypothetical protein
MDDVAKSMTPEPEMKYTIQNLPIKTEEWRPLSCPIVTIDGSGSLGAELALVPQK